MVDDLLALVHERSKMYLVVAFLTDILAIDTSAQGSGVPQVLD